MEISMTAPKLFQNFRVTAMACQEFQDDQIFAVTILFKVATRMKLLISNYLGDYSYSFQGSSEIIRITVTAALFFYETVVTGNQFPQQFSRIFCNYSYMI